MSRGTDPQRLDEALQLLGLDRGADPTRLRTSYRELIRLHHPDVGGDAGHAQRLTEAQAVVSAAYDDAGRLPAAPSAPTAPPPDIRETAPTSTTLDDEDSLTIIAPSDDVFLAMYEAVQAVGDVTYVDRDGGLLEALVAITDQPPSQLLVTFQGRAHGTEALFTLTANGNETPPKIAAVVERVAHALRNPAI